MNKIYKINYLSQDFFIKYNSVSYPEIENKVNRPYMVLLVKIDSNTFAIPFRTNVKHKACYCFKNTSRDTSSNTGLDYSKAVIVNEAKYIGNPAFIDSKEFIELNSKYHFIIKQFTAYVNGYKKYVAGQLNKFDSRKYKFSTLQYFHSELGIP
jgi:protein AbiQ